MALADVDSFLKDLLKQAGARLQELPPDPLANIAARRAEEAAQRHAASLNRLAKIEDFADLEHRWAKQVRQRKLEDRQRVAEEAEAAELAAAKAATPVAEPETGFSAAEAALARAEQEWLAAEWAPALARRREELKALREEEAARMKEVQQLRGWELDAMGREDLASREWVEKAEEACSSVPAPDPATSSLAEAILDRHHKELEWRQQRELRQSQAKDPQRTMEERRKELAHREWMEQVHNERCRRARLKAREQPCAEDDALRRQMELQGRDLLKERELEQRKVLEATLQAAVEERARLQEVGRSPRDVLQRARRLAEEQSLRRPDLEDVLRKAVEDQWDALLAKNRLAIQERGKTTRWGALT